MKFIIKQAVSTPPVSALLGKTVELRINTTTILGIVKSTNNGTATVDVCVPDGSKGIIPSGVTIAVPLSDCRVVDPRNSDNTSVKVWSSSTDVQDIKAASEVKDADGNIIDYRDVSFKGYGSTFVTTTPSDRVGDYILDGAFDDTIKEFSENPVMLIDHRRSVSFMAGSYKSIKVDKKGLVLEGVMSNSPHPDMVHARFLVKEGHLTTLSIGGLFFYGNDGRAITKIKLYEVSLVTVPANPDARFSVRSLMEADVSKMWGLPHLTRNI